MPKAKMSTTNVAARYYSHLQQSLLSLRGSCLLYSDRSYTPGFSEWRKKRKLWKICQFSTLCVHSMLEVQSFGHTDVFIRSHICICRYPHRKTQPYVYRMIYCNNSSPLSLQSKGNYYINYENQMKPKIKRSQMFFSN